MENTVENRQKKTNPDKMAEFQKNPFKISKFMKKRTLLNKRKAI